MNLLSWINQYVSKKDYYSIPYWDRVRMLHMADIPDYDTGLERLHFYPIDKYHYLVSQLTSVCGEYKRYELLLVTIHDLQKDGRYIYKTYKPLRVIKF